jgi:hypothetical protein
MVPFRFTAIACHLELEALRGNLRNCPRPSGKVPWEVASQADFDLPGNCTLRKPLLLVFCFPLLPLSASAADPGNSSLRVEDLARAIPARSLQDLTGSQFVRHVAPMNAGEREQAILEELSKGNLPEFLRKLVPVGLQCEFADGKKLVATIFVTPDYLAIGSDGDFLRMPMNLHTALAIAGRFGFVLPTRKMVDAIYLQAQHHLVPQPLPAGDQMRSTQYYWTHNELIDDQEQTLGARPGDLVSGDKKDVVMTNRLTQHLGRIAIYGWHRAAGQPIQPLSTVHGANYADYSHGIRLVSRWALIDGKRRLVRDVLHDPSTAQVLSDEGPIQLHWTPLAARLDTAAADPARSN